MNKLAWHTVPHAELSLLLKQATLDDSRAVGNSTVYHLTLEGRDVLAIALADGQAVVVEAAPLPQNKRRRVDPTPPSFVP